MDYGIEGAPKNLRRVFDEGYLNSLTEPSERAMRPEQARYAVGAVLAVVVLAAFEVLPIAALALIASAFVILVGCLDTRDAYKSIRLDILVLIFGMLAVGKAMEKTGAAEWIVTGLTAQMGMAMPIVVLAGLYIFTSFLTEILSNNAAAILLTPIAIGLAEQFGLDPRPFVVAVMFAASASFATPIGYQTNTLVYSAGGYKFSDFLRIGIPLNAVMAVTAVLVIPVFWPLVPV